MSPYYTNINVLSYKVASCGINNQFNINVMYKIYNFIINLIFLKAIPGHRNSPLLNTFK